MCTLQTQAILNYMMSAGLLSPLKHGESALFAMTAAALMWVYRADGEDDQQEMERN